MNWFICLCSLSSRFTVSCIISSFPYDCSGSPSIVERDPLISTASHRIASHCVCKQNISLALTRHDTPLMTDSFSLTSTGFGLLHFLSDPQIPLYIGGAVQTHKYLILYH